MIRDLGAPTAGRHTFTLAGSTKAPGAGTYRYVVETPGGAPALHVRAWYMRAGEDAQSLQDRVTVAAREPGLLRVATPTKALVVRYDPALFAAATETHSTHGDARLTPGAAPPSAPDQTRTS